MKIKCPDCESEYLDQGLDGKILCHGLNRDGSPCGSIFEIIKYYKKDLNGLK